MFVRDVLTNFFPCGRFAPRFITKTYCLDLAGHRRVMFPANWQREPATGAEDGYSGWQEERKSRTRGWDVTSVTSRDSLKPNRGQITRKHQARLNERDGPRRVVLSTSFLHTMICCGELARAMWRRGGDDGGGERNGVKYAADVGGAAPVRANAGPGTECATG